MKLKLSLFILVSLFFIKGFSQEDHLGKTKKPKEDKAKDEQKLNAKGKGEFDKAKAEFKTIKGATFELAANEIANDDIKSLLGFHKSENFDPKMAEKQHDENKKNQKEINEKVKKDTKNDKNDIDLSASGDAPAVGTGGVGASWTDSWFFNPSYHTPVKNQYRCGSCWAFASCAAFEHAYKKFYGVEVDLSEQDILDCGQTCPGLFRIDAGGCNGSMAEFALDYLKCTGVASEASYPYTSIERPCYSRPRYKSAYAWGQIGSYVSFTSRDWIKYYITIYGSVISSMKAGLRTFVLYGYGVYNGYPSNYLPWDVDHVVTIVGWSDYYSAWIIKNSWGSNWGGYGGYAYVGYNQCNLARWAFWVYPNY